MCQHKDDQTKSAQIWICNIRILWFNVLTLMDSVKYVHASCFVTSLWYKLLGEWRQLEVRSTLSTVVRLLSQLWRRRIMALYSMWVCSTGFVHVIQFNGKYFFSKIAWEHLFAMGGQVSSAPTASNFLGACRHPTTLRIHQMLWTGAVMIRQYRNCKHFLHPLQTLTRLQ